MSRDKRGNGIPEVDGSIPFGSTSLLMTCAKATTLSHSPRFFRFYFPAFPVLPPT
jgi:hypothetical protein